LKTDSWYPKECGACKSLWQTLEIPSALHVTPTGQHEIESSSFPLRVSTFEGALASDLNTNTACPASGDIFQSSFPKLETKARRSPLLCFSENRLESFDFEFCFWFWKMSLQVQQAVP